MEGLNCLGGHLEKVQGDVGGFRMIPVSHTHGEHIEIKVLFHFYCFLKTMAHQISPNRKKSTSYNHHINSFPTMEEQNQLHDKVHYGSFHGVL